MNTELPPSKSQLIISGDISQEDFEKEKLEVIFAHTKSPEVPEIIQLIFWDFDAWTFLRDGLLFTFLINATKDIFQWFKKILRRKGPAGGMHKQSAAVRPGLGLLRR